MLMNRWLEGIGSSSAGQHTGEPGMSAATRERIRVGSALDDPALEHQNSARRPHGGRPARDRGPRPPMGQFITSGLNRTPGHQALAAGETAPARTHNDVVPLLQTSHDTIETGSTQRGVEVGIDRVGSSGSQVRSRHVVEEVSVLSNQAERVRHAVGATNGQLADVVSLEKYRTLVDVGKPHEETGKRRLTGSRFADDRDRRSRGHDKVDPVQRPISVEPITVVPEQRARHPHFASHRI